MVDLNSFFKTEINNKTRENLLREIDEIINQGKSVSKEIIFNIYSVVINPIKNSVEISDDMIPDEKLLVVSLDIFLQKLKEI